MPEFYFTWVSPYHPDDARGGWKAMQFHLLRTLEAKLGPAQRVAPVEVPEEFGGKWLSRMQKYLRIPRRYAYYSETRLADYAATVHTQLPQNDLKPVVFFGPLPFVKCRPAAPYFIFTDGAFFIHYWEYSLDHSHRRSDIERILQAEAEFMRGAARVWCSSQKVANRITREYNLAPNQAIFVGTGPGDVPAPAPAIRHENFLVMIGTDFERKGGPMAVASVAEARKLGVDVAIKFIGAKPPAEILALPFVEWCGWLNMNQAADRDRFAREMSQAGAQILLSRNDLTPLAIAEAALYSKATIATTVGGIPEMILDEQTGWLVRPEASPAEIGERIAKIFQEPEQRIRNGGAARAFCAKYWSWDAVGERCVATMPRNL